jgi:cytochrome c-type biogenesis protein CcmH
MSALDLFGMAVVAVIALAWLTRPLWRSASTASFAHRQANATAYRLRLAELERDVAAGVVAPEAMPDLRQELDARLLDDAARPEPLAASASPPSGGRALLLVMVLAATAGLAYWQAGSWRLAEQIAQKIDSDAPDTAQIEGMVQKLAERLRVQPDDPEGWAMLGRSNMVLQHYGDAAAAYAEANRRSPAPRADWLTDEGEALAVAAQRNLAGKPRQLFAAALALEPDYGKALWYAGLAAAQAGDAAEARQHWRALLAQDVPGEVREAVTQQLTQLPPDTAGSAGPDAAQAPVAVAAPVKLTVHVTLAPQLVAQMKSSQTLFVFAKAAAGPPMPLAVQRIPNPTLPLTLTLDDAQAMMPSMKLSSFKRWIVTARLSASGGAQPQAGDWQGSLTVDAAEAGKPVAIEIGEVVGAP